ncbi:hypothetical protein ABPG75_012401 [Micractinium tetrahymenae]
MQEATPDGTQPVPAPQDAPAAPLLSPAVAPDSTHLERQLSQQLLLLHAGSLAAAGLSGLGLGGSQDLGSLLDAGSLQGTPRGFELDLLASPKWKALLSWEASGSASASPRHLDSATSSGAASHATALQLPPATASLGGAPASPGVDQQAAAAAVEAAWLQAAAQQAQQVLAALQQHPLGEQGQPAGEHPADEEMAAAEVAAAAAAAAALMPAGRAGRRTSGVGKKRPSWAATSADSQPATPTAAPPPSKQMRPGQAPGAAPGEAAACRPPRPPAAGTSRFGLQAAAEQGQRFQEDVLMMDAEAAAADAAASAAAFDAAAAASLAAGEGDGEAFPQGETAAEAALLSGLSRVRLNSIGGTLEQRRLTAAAAAAAVGPAGRRGFRLQRGDSGVQMLVPPGLLPSSPTWGACAPHTELAGSAEPDKTGKAGKAQHGSPAVRVEVKVETGDLPAIPLPLPPLEQLYQLSLPLPVPLPHAAAQDGGDAAAGAEAAAAWAAAWPAAQHTAAAAAQGKPKRQVLPTKSHKAVATGEGGVFTSSYRGVTRHRLTGRFEAHFWDSSYVRPTNPGKKSKRTRGRQVYVGGYETELEAARAYDRAVIAYLGMGAPLNFPPKDYADDLVWMAGRSPEEVVSILRKGSVGFTRGQSQYRGVTRHHQHGKWESRIGKVDGSRYLYLGMYDTAEEAARAYDRACVKFRGARAILNFDLSDYQDILEDPDSYDPAAATAAASSAGTAGTAGAAAAAGAVQDPGVAMAAAAAAAAAAALGGQFLVAGAQLGLLPGAGVFLPLVAEAAPQMWGLAGLPGVGFALQYQPSPLDAPTYQPSLPIPYHYQPPVLGTQQDMSLSPGSYQPSPLRTGSHQPCPPASSCSAFSPVGAADSWGAAAAESSSPLLRLPAIRTRVAATVAAAAAAAAASAGDGTGCGTAVTAGTPMTAGSADMDLAGFLLSPLAASLLSPLALAGTPGSGWRDSPLSRFFAAGSLLSPDGRQHRRANTGGSTATTAQVDRAIAGDAGAAAGNGSSSAAEGQAAVGRARLFSTPTTEADLASALQWLDSLDPAQLAALLDSPAAGAGSPGFNRGSGASSAGGSGSQQAGSRPAEGV